MTAFGERKFNLLTEGSDKAIGLEKKDTILHRGVCRPCYWTTHWLERREDVEWSLRTHLKEDKHRESLLKWTARRLEDELLA